MTTLQSVKSYLRVMHDLDDDLLTELIVSAEDEARRFLNMADLPADETSSNGDLPGSVFTAICCLVKADYEASTDDQHKLREIAERKLMPYRVEMGI